MFRDADIVLFRGESLISKLIRKLLREGEERAVVNHVGLIVDLDEQRLSYVARLGRGLGKELGLRRQYVLEALGKGVVLTPVDTALSRGDDWWVYRAKGLDPSEADIVADVAFQFVSAPYSYLRLLLFGIDKLLGTRLAARFSPGSVVCSYIPAFAFWPIGREFEGKIAGNVTPDDIWDEVNRAGDRWELVAYSREEV